MVGMLDICTSICWMRIIRTSWILYDRERNGCSKFQSLFDIDVIEKEGDRRRLKNYMEVTLAFIYLFISFLFRLQNVRNKHGNRSNQSINRLIENNIYGNFTNTRWTNIRWKLRTNIWWKMVDSITKNGKNTSHHHSVWPVWWMFRCSGSNNLSYISELFITQSDFILFAIFSTQTAALCFHLNSSFFIYRSLFNLEMFHIWLFVEVHLLTFFEACLK